MNTTSSGISFRGNKGDLGMGTFRLPDPFPFFFLTCCSITVIIMIILQNLHTAKSTLFSVYICKFWEVHAVVKSVDRGVLSPPAQIPLCPFVVKFSCYPRICVLPLQLCLFQNILYTESYQWDCTVPCLVWLLSLSKIHLRVIHVVAWISSLSHCLLGNIPLHRSITVYPFIR